MAHITFWTFQKLRDNGVVIVVSEQRSNEGALIQMYRFHYQGQTYGYVLQQAALENAVDIAGFEYHVAYLAAKEFGFGQFRN